MNDVTTLTGNTGSHSSSHRGSSSSYRHHPPSATRHGHHYPRQLQQASGQQQQQQQQLRCQFVPRFDFGFCFRHQGSICSQYTHQLNPPPLLSSQLLLCLHNMAMSMTLFASQPRRRLACGALHSGLAMLHGRGGAGGSGCSVAAQTRRRRGRRRSSPVWFCRQKSAKTNAQIYVTHTLHCGQVSTYLASVVQAADTTQ